MTQVEYKHSVAESKSDGCNYFYWSIFDFDQTVRGVISNAVAGTGEVSYSAPITFSEVEMIMQKVWS